MHCGTRQRAFYYLCHSRFSVKKLVIMLFVLRYLHRIQIIPWTGAFLKPEYSEPRNTRQDSKERCTNKIDLDVPPD